MNKFIAGLLLVCLILACTTVSPFHGNKTGAAVGAITGEYSGY